MEESGLPCQRISSEVQSPICLVVVLPFIIFALVKCFAKVLEAIPLFAALTFLFKC